LYFQLATHVRSFYLDDKVKLLFLSQIASVAHKFVAKIFALLFHVVASENELCNDVLVMYHTHGFQNEIN